MNEAVLACVGLGGNLGKPALTLTAAIERLAMLADTTLVARSRLYRTPAWGNEAQPDFINAAALLRTRLQPLELLERLLAVEHDFGRDRRLEQRWGPRTLDLDLLLYGDDILDLPGLEVPHPRLHERAFALVPLLDVLPQARIPGRGGAREALSVLDLSNIQPL